MAEDSLLETFVDGLRAILQQCLDDAELVETICRQVGQGTPFRMEQKILDLVGRLNVRILPTENAGQAPTSQTTLVQDQIHRFIDWKRRQINESNLVEFLGTSALAPDSCSRLDTRHINRSCQIKTAVVENWEGPLDRTTTLGTEESTSKRLREESKEQSNADPADPLFHLTPNVLSLAETEEVARCVVQSHEQDCSSELIAPVHNDGRQGATSDQMAALNLPDRYSIEQRLAPVEQHLKLKPKKYALLERIKRVEDKIINIECNYPFLAYYHFNYATTTEPANAHRCKEQYDSEQQASKDLQSINGNPRLLGTSTEGSSTSNRSMNEEQVYQKLCGMKRKILGSHLAL